MCLCVIIQTLSSLFQNLHTTIVMDVGTSLNPALDIGQVQSRLQPLPSHPDLMWLDVYTCILLTNNQSVNDCVCVCVRACVYVYVSIPVCGLCVCVCRWRGASCRVWVCTPWRSCATPPRATCSRGVQACTRSPPSETSPPT